LKEGDQGWGAKYILDLMQGIPTLFLVLAIIQPITVIISNIL
jgi:hypothetical protein